MGNEKYLNYYIETLTATMTDCIVRNVSLQANAKVTNEVIENQSKQIEELHEQLQELRNKNDLNDNQIITNLQSVVNQQQTDITNLNAEIGNLRNIKTEYDNIKTQANHVDTFRTELIKSRKETEDLNNYYEQKISELNTTIEYLQLTPAKRKKADEFNKKEEPILVSSELITKDGGSF